MVTLTIRVTLAEASDYVAAFRLACQRVWEQVPYMGGGTSAILQRTRTGPSVRQFVFTVGRTV